MRVSAFRRSPLLLLAATLVALAVFFVHDSPPASADHRTTTVWSDYLIPSDLSELGGTGHGCADDTVACGSLLANPTFKYDGKSYEIRRVTVDAGTLTFATKPQSSFSGLELSVGDRTLAFADATYAGGSSSWSNTGLAWNNGGTFQLALTEPASHGGTSSRKSRDPDTQESKGAAVPTAEAEVSDPTGERTRSQPSDTENNGDSSTVPETLDEAKPETSDPDDEEPRDETEPPKRGSVPDSTDERMRRQPSDARTLGNPSSWERPLCKVHRTSWMEDLRRCGEV